MWSFFFERNYMIISYLSALGLGLSGIFITIVGMLFSIEGLTLWLPSPEWSTIIIAMAISFEIAKLATSTFLFHYIRTKGFPLFFKGFLLIATLGLVFVSSASIFVHLNKYASTELNVHLDVQRQIQSIYDRNKTLNESKLKLDNQINDTNSDNVNGKLQIYRVFKNERDRIDKEIVNNEMVILSLQDKLKEEDKFAFMNGLTNLFNISRESLYTLFILFLVLLIDPLAISLIIASSFVFTLIKNENKEVVNKTVTQTHTTVHHVDHTNNTEDDIINDTTIVTEPVKINENTLKNEEDLVTKDVEEKVHDEKIVDNEEIKDDIPSVETIESIPVNSTKLSNIEIIDEKENVTLIERDIDSDKIIESVSFEGDNVKTRKKIFKKVNTDGNGNSI